MNLKRWVVGLAVIVMWLMLINIYLMIQMSDLKEANQVDVLNAYQSETQVQIDEMQDELNGMYTEDELERTFEDIADALEEVDVIAYNLTNAITELRARATEIQNEVDGLDTVVIEDLSEEEALALLFDALNNSFDQEVLNEIVIDVLNDQDFYRELDENVNDYIEQYFLDMLEQIMIEIEAQNQGVE